MKLLKTLLVAVLLIAGVNLGTAVAADYTRSSSTYSVNTYVPTTGGTVTITRSNDTSAILNPAADLAALTISLPSSPRDGDRVTITSNKAITTLTFTNGTVTNGPARLSAGSSFGMIYVASNSTWNQYTGIGGSGGVDKINGITGAVQGAMVRLTSGAYTLATSTCGLFASATTCANVLGYADPRAFGASCAGNTAVDDSAGIQAAINTNKPVLIPGICTIVNKLNFNADGQTIFSFGSGGRYNSSLPGSSPYLFLNNGLWDNRATSLNCAIDTNGYDNVTVKNLAIRANFNAVGSVAMCNSTGVRSPRGAAFLNIQDVSCLNMGNCVGAAMESYFDYDGTASDTVTLGTGTKSFTASTGKLWTAGMSIRATATGISPSTFMTATVTSYDSVTGALVIDVSAISGTAGTYSSWGLNSSNRCTPITTGAQAAIANNVFQVRAKGLDMIGNCMGMYGNFSDFHLNDFYAANMNHNVIASLPGFGSAWDINNGRVEYSGFGAGPSASPTYFNDAAGLYFDAPFGVNVSNVICDHQYGTCMTAGPNSRNINWNNIISIDSGYTSKSGITDKSHFAILGTQGLSATNIVTRRNAVATPYVLTVRGTNTYVRWQGAGGTSGAGSGPGGWATGYFNLVTTPTPFTYDVLGVGYSMAGTAAAFSDLTATTLTETVYDAGNSGTALTLNLTNGMVQKVTATGNATITMPAQANGKRFTVRYYTGAGSFTATFSGVKWAGGSAPTLTATASRLDVFRFESDGTNWYGSIIGQNYTP